MHHTPYNYLPLYARMAIEWVDANYSRRSHQHLVTMLHAYATARGETVTQQVIEDCSHHCERRFPNYEGGTQ